MARTLEPAPGGRPSPARAWLRALELTAGLERDPSRLLVHVIEDIAGRTPAAPALLSDRESFSFAELAVRARLYTRWALSLGLGKGDVVALMMTNRPEYMAAWLGVSRTGAVVALLNTNLTGAALSHCLGVAEPTHMIVEAILAGALADALSDASDGPQVWVHGDGAGGVRLDQTLQAFDSGPLSADETPPLDLRDRALLIYTSGTTGLPKAANVSHHRIMSWSHWFAGLAHTTQDDRLYNCLPMYHSVGGVVATGAVLVSGGSVVVRERFSATAFWDEVVRWDCTIFQYIGELCRYLAAAPPSPAERRHRLRIACGNGLRPDIWTEFERRFAIPWILEFYASTEGNFSLFNAEGEPGAIGRIPGFLSHRFPAAIVRFDPDTESPVRGEGGLCIRCGPNEPGEAIGRIGGAGALAQRFEGYTDPQASERKVLRNVFEMGDAWLRTGDLMQVDAKGFYRFVDRIGDTFRWKGENVSTTEVADAIAAAAGVRAAVVYGVEAPGHDGRAGMATLVPDDGFDLDALHRALATRLAAYARPRFLRLADDLDVTETFKTKKQDLVRQSFDPQHGAVYFDNGERYVQLDQALHAALRAGAERL